MFQTSESGRLPASNLFAPDEYYWTHVEVPLSKPWFHITYVAGYEGDYPLSQVAMVSQVDRLVEIATRIDVKIKHVDLVSPHHMNGGDRWKMEPLKEVWIQPSQHEEEGLFDYIYVLENGKQYHSVVLAPDNSSHNRELIIRI